MEASIQRAAKVLGASSVQSAGAYFSFASQGAGGDELAVSMSGAQQRLMVVLKDAAGVTRSTVDVGPVSHVTEDVEHPGRVTVHVGHVLVHLDSQPTFGVEITSA
jgi:hypothetical protein